MWMYLGFLLIEGAAAQLPFFGGCPKVETKASFDVEKYLDKWYEAERYFAAFEFGGKCVTATYTANDKGTVTVVNRQISSMSGVESKIEGTATQKDSEHKARLAVVFPSIRFEAPYWVLDTDYTSFAVVYSCNDFGIMSTRNLWILTREQNPPVAVLKKSYQVLDKNKISKAFLVRTDQKNCPKVSNS